METLGQQGLTFSFDGSATSVVVVKNTSELHLEYVKNSTLVGEVPSLQALMALLGLLLIEIYLTLIDKKILNVMNSMNKKQKYLLLNSFFHWIGLLLTLAAVLIAFSNRFHNHTRYAPLPNTCDRVQIPSRVTCSRYKSINHLCHYNSL